MEALWNANPYLVARSRWLRGDHGSTIADTLETPGTNKLAMHLAELLADEYETQWIVRHQMLEDPRVPCTNKNGSVSMALSPRAGGDAEALMHRVRPVVLDWCPVGSDPGLCITEHVPMPVMHWGRRAQRELVDQGEAAALAAELGIYLEPLGGTGDGIIGALAAVGLLATQSSGRVVYCGRTGRNAFDITGCLDVPSLVDRGVDEIMRLDTNEPVSGGMIDLGKRLRPNMRNGRVVLYVLPASENPDDWEAQRLVA